MVCIDRCPACLGTYLAERGKKEKGRESEREKEREREREKERRRGTARESNRQRVIEKERRRGGWDWDRLNERANLGASSIRRPQPLPGGA
jgi:hypothetical protein